MVLNIRRFLSKNDFIKNVLTLMTGSGIAQIISFLTVPLLTRMYSPDAFGLFAFFLGLTSILSVFSTGRYEMALNIPEKDTEARDIVILCFIINSGFCLFLMVFLFFLNQKISLFFGKPEIGDIWFLLPFSVFLVSLSQILNFWENRKKNYKKLAINRIVHTFLVGIIQIVNILFLKIDRYGLILGEISGRFLSTLHLVFSSKKRPRLTLPPSPLKSLIFVAKKYKNFPKFLCFGHAINVFSSQTPIFFLDMFFGSGIVGFFALADRALRAPISIISTSISDVFRQKASEDLIQYGNCREIYISTFKKLFFISLLIFIPLYFLCPFLFEFVFGEQWMESGVYAQIMVPMLAFGFIVSPLSCLFMISQNQKLDLLFQIFLVIGSILSFCISIYTTNPKVAVGSFSFFMCTWYVANLIFSYRFSKGK